MVPHFNGIFGSVLLYQLPTLGKLDRVNLFFKDLSAITEEILTTLLDAGVPEGRDVEYKSTFNFKENEHQKTFLKEVAAFANSAGGDILYGVTEGAGIPTGIPGLEAFDVDATILRLNDLIRSRIQPRLFGVQFRPVSLTTGRIVFIVRVPKASGGPFMLEDKFYIRSGPSARPMDYVEVARGFYESETTANQLRNFRLERCARILSGDGPLEMRDSSFTVLHIVPLEALAQPNRFDVKFLHPKWMELCLLGEDGGSPGIDLDGVLKFWQTRERTCSNYSLLMRSGIIESAGALWLIPEQGNESVLGNISYGALEPGTVDALRGNLALLKKLGFFPPFVVFLTLLNVRGFVVPNDGMGRLRGRKPIGKEHLQLPEVIIESFDQDLHEAMRPAFDSIWNACGLAGSLNYDGSGKWNPK